MYGLGQFSTSRTNKGSKLTSRAKQQDKTPKTPNPNTLTFPTKKKRN